MLKHSDICAGIVLFNPEINRLSENLKAILKQCNQVFLINNFSDNTDEIKLLIDNYPNVKLIENNCNEGIAYALNKILYLAKENNYKWVLTLDQDSVCREGLVNEYIKFINSNKVQRIGCLTCDIEDRNFDFIKTEGFENIKYCITSGSLMNIEATIECGGYDEKMFIDKVDLDICIALRKYNYNIIRIGFMGLLHEIGHAKQINLLFRKWEVYNHNEKRRFYMCRNASYLLKKYHNLYVFKFFLKEIFQTILVFVFEDRKIKKLFSSIKGFLVGFFI